MDFESAGQAFVASHGLLTAPEEEIRIVLSSDDLAVNCEDTVLSAVAVLWRFGRVTSASWKCVRYCLLSPAALQQVREWLDASRHASDSSYASIPGDEIAPIFYTHVQLLAARLASAGRDGASLSCGAFARLPPLPDHVPDAVRALSNSSLSRPRRNYAFTAQLGGGVSDAGAGLFFIWLNPKAPLCNNDVAPAAAAAAAAGHPLPPRYESNVHAWGQAYGVTPAVFNGAQCLLAVQQAASSPEFCDLPITPSAAAAHARRGGAWLPSMPPLEAHYLELAAAGAWIECVDIARLAIAWLVGGIYLDCDMSLGPHRFPPDLLECPSPRQPRPLAAAAFRDERARGRADGSWSSRGPFVVVNRPFLVVAQDADGLLQNNFIAVRGAHHPYLTLLLQAIVVSAGLEHHVVQSTGPALLTAVYYAFKDAAIVPSASLRASVSTHDAAAASGGISSARSRAGSRNGPDDDGSGGARAAVLVPARDPSIAAIRAALPSAIPEASFGYLSLIHRVTAPSALSVSMPPPHHHASAGGWQQQQPPLVRSPSPSMLPDLSYYRGGPLQPLDSLTLSDIVWVCPPATFYPRHWRDVTGGEGGAVSADTASALAAHALVTLTLASASGGTAAAAPPARRGRSSVDHAPVFFADNNALDAGEEDDAEEGGATSSPIGTALLEAWTPLSAVSEASNAAMASAITEANTRRRRSAIHSPSASGVSPGARGSIPYAGGWSDSSRGGAANIRINAPPHGGAAARGRRPEGGAFSGASPGNTYMGGPEPQQRWRYGAGRRRGYSIGSSSLPPHTMETPGDHSWRTSAHTGGVHDSSRSGGSSGSGGPIVYGSHSWDCTWGSYGAHAPYGYYAAGYAGGGYAAAAAAAAAAVAASAFGHQLPTSPSNHAVVVDLTSSESAGSDGVHASEGVYEGEWPSFPQQQHGGRGEGGAVAAAAAAAAASFHASLHETGIGALPRRGGRARAAAAADLHLLPHPRDIFGVVALSERVLLRMLAAGLVGQPGSPPHHQHQLQ